MSVYDTDDMVAEQCTEPRDAGADNEARLCCWCIDPHAG